MQTFAVALIGALYGWRLRAITIFAWLVEGRRWGFPCSPAERPACTTSFSRPADICLPFLLPTRSWAGSSSEAGTDGSRMTLAFLGMLLSNAVCLLLDAAWLAVLIGPERAIVFGMMPFLVRFSSPLSARLCSRCWQRGSSDAAASSMATVRYGAWAGLLAGE
jgi:biotin transport system substrate-specific component